jgi:hypothetical protein
MSLPAMRHRPFPAPGRENANRMPLAGTSIPGTGADFRANLDAATGCARRKKRAHRAVA